MPSAPASPAALLPNDVTLPEPFSSPSTPKSPNNQIPQPPPQPTLDGVAEDKPADSSTEQRSDNPSDAPNPDAEIKIEKFDLAVVEDGQVGSAHEGEAGAALKDPDETKAEEGENGQELCAEEKAVAEEPEEEIPPEVRAQEWLDKYRQLRTAWEGTYQADGAPRKLESDEAAAKSEHPLPPARYKYPPAASQFGRLGCFVIPPPLFGFLQSVR